MLTKDNICLYIALKESFIVESYSKRLEKFQENSFILILFCNLAF